MDTPGFINDPAALMAVLPKVSRAVGCGRIVQPQRKMISAFSRLLKLKTEGQQDIAVVVFDIGKNIGFVG